MEAAMLCATHVFHPDMPCADSLYVGMRERSTLSSNSKSPFGCKESSTLKTTVLVLLNWLSLLTCPLIDNASQLSNQVSHEI